MPAKTMRMNMRSRKGTQKMRQTTGKKMQGFERQILVKFLCMLNTVKLFHWKTRSYATHKATDELYSKLNEHIDSFVEIMLGKDGSRVNLTGIKSIRLNDYVSQEQLKREIESFRKYLTDDLNKNKKIATLANSDLMNIRDEIVADLNQFLYLLTFK